MRYRPGTGPRQGFTLVELMVSMALILFIMTILAEAFSAGTETFRRLKGIGDLQDKLRIAGTILKRDLAADHFQGRVRMSDPNFWLNGPPEEGFFRVYNGSPVANVAGTLVTSPTANYQIDGTDTAGPPVYRATDHAIHMMVRYSGKTAGDVFSTSLPGDSPLLANFANGMGYDSRFQAFQTPIQPTRNPFIAYRYPAAEVAYYLRRQLSPAGVQDTTDGFVGLYTLCRTQRLCVPDNNLIVSRPPIPNGAPPTLATTFDYFGMSCYTDPTVAAPQLYFNNPRDLTVPARRFGVSPLVTLTTPPAFTVSNDPTRAGQSVMAGTLGFFDPATTPVYPLVRDMSIVDLSGTKNLTATQQSIGTEVLLPDVLSMDVKILIAGGLNFVDLYDPTLTPFNFTGNDKNGNWSDFRNPAFAGPNGPRVFDTWTQVSDNVFDYTNPPTKLASAAAVQGGALPQTNPATIPLWNMSVLSAVTPPKKPQNINFALIPMYQNQDPTSPNFGQKISIRAIQVTLRIWDSKTRQTRQVTIVQDL